MTNTIGQDLIDDAITAGFINDKDGRLTHFDWYVDEQLAKFAQLQRERQAQPTTGESVDEREKERADAWVNAVRKLCKEELGIDEEDSGGSVKDWNAIVGAVRALIQKNKGK